MITRPVIWRVRGIMGSRRAVVGADDRSLSRQIAFAADPFTLNGVGQVIRVSGVKVTRQIALADTSLVAFAEFGARFRTFLLGHERVAAVCITAPA